MREPFELISYSWPRPIEQVEGRWVSEPEWDAPACRLPLYPRWESSHGDPCWVIDWCDVFDGGLKRWGGPRHAEMRNFHVVFRIRIPDKGMLVFWDDDGSIIRRNGVLAHADRASHPPVRHELLVEPGEILEVAQWQYYGGWTWGARLEPETERNQSAASSFLPFLDVVKRRLSTPNGPPLKIYSSGQSPLRAVVAIYGMILNGYSPIQVLVFGEYQWSQATRRLLSEYLPFADIVPTDEVLRSLSELGQSRLAKLAMNCWGAMKLAISLLLPPDEYCFMDDDVLVLDAVDDALTAFRENDLVFSPDADYSAEYAAAWGRNGGNCIGKVNTGLYWLRNRHKPRDIVSDLLRVPSHSVPVWLWEQGFLATFYARELHCQLPSQRYFYPYFDGLPGGILGYDYAANPCGFATIHFGGLAEKPGDRIALAMAPSILGRRTAQLVPEAQNS